ncbi:MAG: menaquinone-dependent protoporphyrinogen IX dehydrogenase [Proteobacteria bacterium]|jgi:menaquinone-dependent protoporphyrinogen oxidase|nr:menaquinone-dependent protoporphyrinogen IX dehydrogenase [Alphaproteobacteria bacterium]NCC03658.1 menaquinone-dependent protoporphyrinogen IX dehydrogenase [Pseudomonadota bacterium]
MLEAPVVIVFASHDGQTAKIISYLERQLAHKKCAALVCDLGQMSIPSFVLETASAVVVVSPIRYGRHLLKVETFLEEYKPLLKRMRLGMASVNLTARKPNKNTPQTNPYFKKWVKRHGLSPDIGAVFGGRLDYPKYRWMDRQMIRFIMMITGGPTHPRTRLEYTCWADVARFAAQIEALADGAGAESFWQAEEEERDLAIWA